MRFALFSLYGALLLACAASVEAQPTREPDWARIGLTPVKQVAGYWLHQAPYGETALMPPQAITDRNARLLKSEPSMVSWPEWPDTLGVEDIRKRIQALSKRPKAPLFNNDNDPVTEAEIEDWLANLDIANIRPSSDERFGMVVIRTPLRRFPTSERAFDKDGGIDIDRLQESALFPGTPVAVLHESRDRKWLFVQSENYAGWVQTEHIALAPRAEVLAYAGKNPRRWITGARERTVHVPGVPDISELGLEMGTSFPVLENWPLSRPVHGQGVLGSWVIELPARNGSGLLHTVPALLPRAADTSAAALPASQANLIRQGFKFLGERYGWGHDYHARDCSGFVSEVYRSLGILLPRNTGDQQRSLAFERIVFDPELARDQRIERLKKLRVGDLVFIPGHVMMVIGSDRYGPWVIHDSNRTGVIIDGAFTDLPSNGVIVTPLLPLAFSGERLYTDAVTAVQRILPAKP